MATYFVKLSNGYKGQAADKCDYITRNGKYQSETLRQELVASENFNLPSWAPDGKTFLQPQTSLKGPTERHSSSSSSCSPVS